MKRCLFVLLVLVVFSTTVFAGSIKVLNTSLKYARPAVYQANYVNIDLINSGNSKSAGVLELTVSGSSFKDYVLYSKKISISPKSMKNVVVPWSAVKKSEYSFNVKLDGKIVDKKVINIKISTDAFRPVMKTDAPSGFSELENRIIGNVKRPDPRECIEHYFEDAKVVGDKRKFWTVNMTNNKFEQLDSTLKAIGKHCYLYLEDGHDLDMKHIEKLKEAFDVNVYPKDTYYFGSEPKPGVDKDNRVVLLLLDIKDDFEKTGGFVGGYFSPMNEYKESDIQAYNPALHSNECEMFFMDINPGDPKNTKKMAGVIAHEFQHMIHFNHDQKSETWLNEACSQLATYLTGYDHPTNIGSFLKTKIEDSLTTWDGGAIDYGPVYLWLFYIVENYTSDKDTKHKFLNSIVAVSNKKGRAIKVLNMIFENFEMPGFKKIFSDYVTALVINDEKFQDGIYSFRGKLDIDKFGPIKMHVKRSIHTGAFKKTLNEWSQAFVRYSLKAPDSNSVLVEPTNPVFSDKLIFTSKKPGILVWGANNWVTPDESYWPEGSEKRKSGAVQSPLKKIGDKEYVCELGPFNGEIKYDKIDFTFIYEDGTWMKKYEAVEFAISDDDQEIDFSKYVVSLKSDVSKDFMLRIIKRGVRGLEVETKTSTTGSLKASLNGYGQLYDEVDFLIINFASDPDADFTLKISPAVSGHSENLIEAIGSDIDVSIDSPLGSDIDIDIQNLIGSDIDISIKKRIGSDIDIQIESILETEKNSKANSMQTVLLRRKIRAFAKYLVMLSSKVELEDFRPYVAKLNTLKKKPIVYNSIKLNVDRMNYSLDKKNVCLDYLRKSFK